MRRCIEEMGFIVMLLSPLAWARNAYKAVRVVLWAANILLRDFRVGRVPSPETCVAFLGLWGASSLCCVMLTLHVWAVAGVVEGRLKQQ